MIEQISAGKVDKFPLLLSGLLVLGLYSPSSIGGTYSLALWGAYFLLLSILVARIALRKDGLGSIFLCIVSLSIVVILLGATIVSPFQDYRWGGLLGFVLLAMLYVTNLRTLTGGKILRVVFVVANVINVVAGIAIILGSKFVQDLLVEHYSTFYPELVQVMVDRHKPVLSFGSHSTAAFFCYLFFLLNFEAYKSTRKW